MQITIKNRYTDQTIYETEADNVREAVEQAVREGVLLTDANLSYANLSYANLSYANLSYANLSYANLTYANLTEADLRWASLHGADLSGAILDFSCLPFWCGSFGMKVDSRFMRQLAAHICRLQCNEPEGQAIQRLLWSARNAFCRDRDDVGEVE